MKFVAQDIKDAIYKAKRANGSRGVALIDGTDISVEVEGVYNAPGSLVSWSYVYTLIDPLYKLNGNHCFGQKGQGSFVSAVVRWLNSDKRRALKSSEVEAIAAAVKAL